jgi:LacI family transcriptional regulator
LNAAPGWELTALVNALRQPTIKDVARRAGVDPSTVSRVLNDRMHMPISAATIGRIKQAARDLQYTPHAAARALVARRTQTIGLVSMELNHPSHAEIVQVVQGLVENRGYHLLVCSSGRQDEKEARYVRLLNESRVDGILILASMGACQTIAGELARGGAPIVAVGPPLLPEVRDVFTACVAHDNRQVGWTIGHHLGTLGHRRVGYTAAGGWSGSASRLRLQGLQSGLAACGVQEGVRLVELVESDFEGGARAAAELLERHPEVTAFVAFNDSVAAGALQVFWRRGRRVPEEISVVGYHDLSLAAYTIPPLTTMRVPRGRIAQLATDLLFQALAGEPIVEREVLFQPELVIRESTAPPRGS